MAMMRLAAIVWMVALVAACGDTPDGESSGGDDTEECEGEHLKLNYRMCEGEEAWDAKSLEVANETDRRNNEAIDPEEGDVMLQCGDNPDPQTIAHYCSFDPATDDQKCMWRVVLYKNQPGGEPTLFCTCNEQTLESVEGQCG